MRSISAGDSGASRAVAVAAAGPRIIASAGYIARRDNLARTGKLLVIHIDTVIDDCNRSAFTLTRVPGGFHIRVGVNGIAIDGGAFEMPLLGKGAALCHLLHEFRMTQSHVIVSEQGARRLQEFLVTAALRKLHEPGVRCIDEFALAREFEFLEDAIDRGLFAIFSKLNEQVLRIQDRASRCVAQATPGESHGCFLLQREARLVAGRAHRAAGAAAQNIDANFWYGKHRIELRQYTERFTGQRRLTDSSPALSAHDHDVIAHAQTVRGTFLAAKLDARDCRHRIAPFRIVIGCSTRACEYSDIHECPPAVEALP